MRSSSVCQLLSCGKRVIACQNSRGSVRRHADFPVLQSFVGREVGTLPPHFLNPSPSSTSVHLGPLFVFVISQWRSMPPSTVVRSCAARASRAKDQEMAQAVIPSLGPSRCAMEASSSGICCDLLGSVSSLNIGLTIFLPVSRWERLGVVFPQQSP